MNIKPKRDKIHLIVDADVKFERGLHLGYGKVERDRLLQASVQAVGPTVREVEAGDRVLIPRSHAYLQWSEDGSEHIIVKEEQIEAVIGRKAG